MGTVQVSIEEESPSTLEVTADSITRCTRTIVRSITDRITEAIPRTIPSIEAIRASIIGIRAIIIARTIIITRTMVCGITTATTTAATSGRRFISAFGFKV